MRIAIAILAACAFLVAIGCARAKPIPPKQQADYFRCNGVSVQQAEASLAGAGHLIKAKGDTYVQTEWSGVDLGSQGSLAYALAGIHSLEVRISVAKTAEGVKFSLFQRAKQSSGLAQQNREAAWDTILDSQVKDDTSRNILNKARADVCGGPLFFR